MTKKHKESKFVLFVVDTQYFYISPAVPVNLRWTSERWTFNCNKRYDVKRRQACSPFTNEIQHKHWLIRGHTCVLKAKGCRDRGLWCAWTRVITPCSPHRTDPVPRRASCCSSWWGLTCLSNLTRWRHPVLMNPESHPGGVGGACVSLRVERALSST